MTPEERLYVVNWLNKHNFVTPPEDLGMFTEEIILKAIRNNETAYLMLAGFGSKPPEISRILNSENSEEALKLFSVPSNISGKGWNDFNFRCKGILNFLKALRLYLTSIGYGFNISAVEALEIYVFFIQTRCPLTEEDLKTAKGMCAWSAKVVSAHKLLPGLDKYIGQQIARLILWVYIMKWVSENPDSPVSDLADMFPDQNNNMVLFPDTAQSFTDFESQYGIPYILMTIYLCILRNITLAMILSLHEPIRFMEEKTEWFQKTYDHGAGLRTITGYFHTEWKKKNRGASLLEIFNEDEYFIRDEELNLSNTDDRWFVVQVLDAPNVKRELRHTGARGKYVLRLKLPSGQEISIPITMVQYNEIFVTPLPDPFQKTLIDNPGEYYDLPSTSLSRTEMISSNIVAPSCSTRHKPLDVTRSEHDLTGRTEVIVANDQVDGKEPFSTRKHPAIIFGIHGQITFQAPPHSKYCLWLAVLNIAWAMGMDCSTALELLAVDAKTISYQRIYEGKNHREVFAIVNKMLPGIQFRDTNIKTVNQILDLKERPNVPAAFLEVSQFHAVAVIKGMIVDSFEPYPIELTLENLRKCSDYARGDFNNLKVSV